MQIWNLIENNEGREGCLYEHGLSFYVETQKHRLLIDTGASSAFLQNAALLGIDLQKADTVIVSHGHYDHAGGVMDFARQNPEAAIYIRKCAAGNYYSTDGKTAHYIGIDKDIMKLPGLHALDGDVRIDQELFLFSGVTGRRMFSKSNLRLKEKVGEAWLQDSFAHEQYLVIEQEGKRYLFSGCAHNGILNILDRFKELYGCAPDFVFSGFHYMKNSPYSEEEIRIITDTARELEKEKTVFYTCHCTGLPAYELMKPILKERLIFVKSGMKTEC